MTPYEKRLKARRREERGAVKIDKRQAELALELLTIIPVYVLHEKYGFGKKRLSDFLIAMGEQVEDFMNGRTELSTLANIVDADTGVKYKEETREWVI